MNTTPKQEVEKWEDLDLELAIKEYFGDIDEEFWKVSDAKRYPTPSFSKSERLRERSVWLRWEK